MKKILTLLCVFLLCSAFQCDDEPLEGEFTTAQQAACEQSTVVAVEASLQFLIADDTNFTEVCNSYKAALEAQIIACGDADGSLQQIIDQLGDCTNDNQPDDNECEMAETESDEAEANFDASTDANYTDNCNAYKVALQSLIEACGDDDGSLQAEIDGLGDCTQPNNNEATGQITVTAGTLNIIFDEIAIEVEGTTLKVSGETSASNNYAVYFEIEEGETGSELINDTFVIMFTSEFSPSTESSEPFTSEITVNANNRLEGTFSGLTRNTQNADLNLTSGVIDIEF